MKKILKILKMMFIKIIFVAGTLAVASWINRSVSHSTECWLYSLAGLISFLIFGETFLKKNFSRKSTETFLQICQGLIITFLIIFLISFTDVFNGPYGEICRWPLLINALILELFTIIPQLLMKNEGFYLYVLNIIDDD